MPWRADRDSHRLWYRLRGQINEGEIPLSAGYTFHVGDLLQPKARMSWLKDGKFVGNDPLDTWRLVGGNWPREEDLRLFHEKLYSMHAALKQ